MEPRKRKLVANKLAELCKSTERVLRCCLRIGCLSHNCPARGSKGAIPGWGLQCWGHYTFLLGQPKTYKPRHRVYGVRCDSVSSFTNSSFHNAATVWLP